MKTIFALFLVVFSLSACKKNQSSSAVPSPTPQKNEPITAQNISFKVYQTLAKNPVNFNFSPLVLKNIASLLSSELVENKKSILEELFQFSSPSAKPLDYTLSNSMSGSNPKRVLLSTLAFHGRFSSPFKAENTILTHFQSSPHESSTIKIMRQKKSFHYFEDESSKWIELSFSDSSIVMWLALPKKRFELGNVEERLTSDYLNAVGKGLKSQTTEIVLPLFNFGEKLSVKDVLTFAGLDFAFQKQNFQKKSEFSKFNFSEISQVANFSINESGMNISNEPWVDPKDGSSFSILPKKFYADEPFLFILKNKKTGELLLLGRVYKP